MFAKRPPLLRFWYRQSSAPLTGVEFHDDLLTPGIVRPNDPAPTQVGLMNVVLDSEGRLLRFERIPDQLQAPEKSPPAADWSVLFAAARLDPTGIGLVLVIPTKDLVAGAKAGAGN